MSAHPLRPAALAFDSAASTFDERFGEWRSVAAQRRAVRRAIVQATPQNGRILEIGGGTGEDALWLAQNGFAITLTDASPAMVARAQIKLSPMGGHAEVVAAEDFEDFAGRHFQNGGKSFDTAFSNFAPLNCVDDLAPAARGLARLVKPGGAALLVLFGTFPPGEFLVETLRGRPRQAFRRLRRGPVSARLGGQNFTVTYHRSKELAAAMRPCFRLVRRLGIGVFVPPSAAEPWISGHPAFLDVLESLDRAAARPLAVLGDHVLYHFERTDEPAP